MVTSKIALTDISFLLRLVLRKEIMSYIIYLVDSINSSLDIKLYVRSVFHYISRAFENFWHEGLLSKLKQNDLMVNFPKGSESEWSEIETGVPLVSLLGPLLFLIYINELGNGNK